MKIVENSVVDIDYVLTVDGEVVDESHRLITIAEPA